VRSSPLGADAHGLVRLPPFLFCVILFSLRRWSGMAFFEEFSEPFMRPSASEPRELAEMSPNLDQLVEVITHPPTTIPARRALPRVVFVVGPTSSGKTTLSITLAKTFRGEVINADARQIYRDVHIGTGKPDGVWKKWHGRRSYVYEDVPHHLMDVVPVDQTFSVVEWREAALKAIKAIERRGNLPIIVGGTGLYISALIDNYEFPSVPPHPELRRAHEQRSLDELVKLLLAVDPGAVSVVDLHNKRRVIRALEVVTYSGKKFSESRTQGRPLVDALQVGVYRTQEELKRRVDLAVEDMIDRGLIDEVRLLRERRIPWNAPAMSAIGYRDVQPYLDGRESLEHTVERIKYRTRQYTKRQWTWFKRDPRIRWAHSRDEALTWVKEWLEERS
jgi:tRNA dimethylallyltransferase